MTRQGVEENELDNPPSQDDSAGSMVGLVKWNGHVQDLAACVDLNLHANTILAAQGENFKVNSLMVAASSPFLADLIADSNHDKLILDGVKPDQVVWLVEFMSRGAVDRIPACEVSGLLEVARQLQVTGLLATVPQLQVTGLLATVPLSLPDTQDEDEDDVFIDNDEAVDLSPVNRQPVTSQLSVVRRFASLNKISEALLRSPTGCRSPTAAGCSNSKVPSLKHTTAAGCSNSKVPSYQHTTAAGCSNNKVPSHQHNQTISRTNKPKPLLNLLSSQDLSANTLKIKTPPKTPLIATPDCLAMEEKFRHLIETCSPEQQLKLRNLSVSSADFSLESGYPITPRGKHQLGNIDDGIVKPELLPGGLKQETWAGYEVPAINIIKPEPPDLEEHQPSIAASPEDPSTTSIDEPADTKYDTSSGFFFPSLNLSLSLPYHQYLQSRLLASEQTISRDFNSNPTSSVTPADDGPQTQNETKPKHYKCNKCGKSYNWNYNLNRHMKFECGIENKFECALCQKRFPYKQNAAVHLKRKHKINLETADMMIKSGQIINLTNIPITF